MTAPAPPVPAERRPLLVTLGWWAATIATLVVLDDLTFGPFFWLIARLASPTAAFATAVAIYVPAQVLLVRAGTSERPGRLATWFLTRLDLQRRSEEIGRREQRLRARVTGIVSALALSVVIGGVLPPLMLWRAGFGRRFVRTLSVPTAVIYALEFGVIHGLVPGLV